MTIPREVLRWIQELDLTIAVRNSSRDLANGYVVAEILNRYFPDEVAMHAFEDGISEPIRRDNWDQITKLLSKKVNISITPELVHDTMYYKDGASVKVLTELYIWLTKRAMPVVIRSQSVTTPSYAAGTSSWIVKDPDIDRIVDDSDRRTRTALAMYTHEESTKQKKGFTPLVRPGSIGKSDKSRVIAPSSAARSVQVKSIEVKAFGRSTADIAPDQSNNTSPMQSHMEPATCAQISVQSLITQCISRCIVDANVAEPFLELISDIMESPEHALALVHELADHSFIAECGRAVLLSSGSEFYLLWHFLYSVFRLSDTTSPQFAYSLTVLEKMGTCIASSSPLLSHCLVMDCIAPSIATLPDDKKPVLEPLLKTHWVTERN